jgi:hypothetical protein
MVFMAKIQARERQPGASKRDAAAALAVRAGARRAQAREETRTAAC